MNMSSRRIVLYVVRDWPADGGVIVIMCCYASSDTVFLAYLALLRAGYLKTPLTTTSFVRLSLDFLDYLLIPRRP